MYATLLQWKKGDTYEDTKDIYLMTGLNNNLYDNM